jgi:putative ABC transport system substrate-binding protein
MARAQQPLPVVGFLHAGSSVNYVPQIAGLHQGLRESGYVEGQNIAFEYRWRMGESKICRRWRWIW